LQEGLASVAKDFRKKGGCKKWGENRDKGASRRNNKSFSIGKGGVEEEAKPRENQTDFTGPKKPSVVETIFAWGGAGETTKKTPTE